MRWFAPAMTHLGDEEALSREGGLRDVYGSGGYDHAGARGARQQRELDIEADLQGIRDGSELPDRGVAAACLQGRDDGL
jgi:hypothetical protein